MTNASTDDIQQTFVEVVALHMPELFDEVQAAHPSVDRALVLEAVTSLWDEMDRFAARNNPPNVIPIFTPSERTTP